MPVKAPQGGERLAWAKFVCGFIERRASGPQRQLRIDPVYVHQVVLHSHAARKAWLITLQNCEIDRICGHRTTFPAQMVHTITTFHGSIDDLEEARRRCFAISYEKSELGVGAIAAPIIVEGLHPTRRCVDGVSLVAPTSRMNRGASWAAVRFY